MVQEILSVKYGASLASALWRLVSTYLCTCYVCIVLYRAMQCQLREFSS